MRSIRDSICSSEICGAPPPLFILIGPPDKMLDSLLNRGDERWLLDMIAVSVTAVAAAAAAAATAARA